MYTMYTTTYSAPNYCGGKNLGAVMRYRDQSKILDPEGITRSASFCLTEHHLSISLMYFLSSL